MKGQNRPPIRVAAYIRVGDQLLDIDSLNWEQRTVLATKLKERYLNELFIGKAAFSSPELHTGMELFDGIFREGL